MMVIFSRSYSRLRTQMGSSHDLRDFPEVGIVLTSTSISGGNFFTKPHLQASSCPHSPPPPLSLFSLSFSLSLSLSLLSLSSLSLLSPLLSLSLSLLSLSSLTLSLHKGYGTDDQMDPSGVFSRTGRAELNCS